MKEWYESLTMRAGIVFALLLTLETQGVIPPGTEEGVRNLWGSIWDVIQGVSGILTLWGLRRAVPASVVRAAPVVLAIIPILMACATYNASAIESNAARFVAASGLSTAECEAFRLAAIDLRAGPDQALKVIGRAGELEDLAVIMERRALECDEALRRPDMPPGLVERIRRSFSQTWTDAANAVR